MKKITSIMMMVFLSLLFTITSCGGGDAGSKTQTGSGGVVTADTPTSTADTGSDTTVVTTTDSTGTPVVPATTPAATVTKIEISPSTASIPNGTNQQLTATSVYSDGSTTDITSEVTWSVDKSNYGYVTSSAEFRSLKVGTVEVTAASGDFSAKATMTITSATLVKIEIDPATKTFPTGITYPFVANGIYSDNSTKDITADVAWSSDSANATVNDTASNKGKVTGVSAGTAKISASLSGKSATSDVIITAIASNPFTALIIAPTNSSVPVNGFQQYSAVAYFKDNSSMDVTQTATWSIIQTGTLAAKVEDAELNEIKGRIKGLSAGTVQIKAEITLGTGGDATAKSVQTDLTVNAATLNSITVTPDNPISYGTTQQFKATGIYSDGSRDITDYVLWESTNESIATISNTTKGLATSVAAGTTTIKASLLGKTGSTGLEVKITTLKSIAVVATVPSPYNINEVVQYRANGTYSDGTVQEITTQVVWTSTASAVSQVSNTTGSKGIVTAVSSGTATIKATKDFITGSADLTVNTPDIVKPKVVSAVLLTGNRILVSFDEDLNLSKATDAANYTIPSLAVSAVTAQSLKEYILQVGSTAATTYTLTVNESVTDIVGNTLDPTAKTTTFMGQDTIPPYLLMATNNSPTSIIVYFSEDMKLGSGDNQSADYYNSSGTYVLTRLSGTTSDCPTISGVEKIDNSTFRILLDVSTYPMAGAQYKIQVSTELRDKSANANQIINPTSVTFLGNEQLRVVSAEALTTSTVKITFNKPVYTSTNSSDPNYDYRAACSNNTDCNKRYAILPPLGDITSASVSENTVTITHQTIQEGTNYSVICANLQDGDQFNNVASGVSLYDSDHPGNASYRLQNAPKDRASFTGLGVSITTPDQGAQFDDPFGDTTATGFSFIYNGKVYIGPNATNSTLVRFDPNGANLVQVGFDTPYCYNPALAVGALPLLALDIDSPKRYDFGHPTNDIDGGPGDVDGVGYFAKVTLNGEQYLLAGTQVTDESQIQQVFLTRSTGTTLQFFPCPATGPANVKSTSAVYGYGDKVYIGVASSHTNQKPAFNINTISSGAPESCTGFNNYTGQTNPTLVALKDTAVTTSGIDVITHITISSGSFAGDYLIIANKHNFMIAPLPAADLSSFVSVKSASWVNVRSYDVDIRSYKPHERGISSIVQYGNDVYVAINKSTSSGIPNYPNAASLRPELWVGTTVDPANVPAGPRNPLIIGNWTWKKVFDANDLPSMGSSTTWGSSIDAISLLVLNGNRLYIGMDSMTEGARLIYLDLSTISVNWAADYTTTKAIPFTNFTQIGRATVTCDPAFSDGTAFGKNCSAKRFFSGASVNYSGKNYLYMSAGDGTGSLKVFRQVDN